MTRLFHVCFLLLLCQQILFASSSRTTATSLRSRGQQKHQQAANTENKPSSQQYLPKTLRSSDFSTIAKQHPRTPPSSLPVSVSEALGQVFGGDAGSLGKLLQKVLKTQPVKEVIFRKPVSDASKKGDEHSKPSLEQRLRNLEAKLQQPSQDDDSLNWIDSIESESALQSLEVQTLNQLNHLNKQLTRIRQAQLRHSKPHPPTSPPPSSSDITSEIFGDLGEQLKNLGMSVKVITLPLNGEDNDEEGSVESSLQSLLGGSTEANNLEEQFGLGAGQGENDDDDGSELDATSVFSVNFLAGEDGQMVMEEIKTPKGLKKAIEGAFRNAFKNINPPAPEAQPAGHPPTPHSTALKELLDKMMSETKKREDDGVIKTTSTVFDPPAVHKDANKPTTTTTHTQQKAQKGPLMKDYQKMLEQQRSQMMKVLHDRSGISEKDLKDGVNKLKRALWSTLVNNIQNPADATKQQQHHHHQKHKTHNTATQQQQQTPTTSHDDHEDRDGYDDDMDGNEEYFAL